MSTKRTRDRISTLKKFILDILFPISCVACGKDDVFLCDDCIEKISLVSEQVCPVCERITMPNGQVCHQCKKKTKLTSLLVAASYQGEVIKKAVHLLKYRFVSGLAAPLGKILAKAILNSTLPVPELIIPIPLHPRRLRWRGFNQSELLTDYLSENLTPGLKIPVEKSLIIRKKHIQPQMEVKNFKDRRLNLKNVFFMAEGINKDIIKGKDVLIVDDICTTGTTLFECSEVLSKLKPRRLDAVVIARPTSPSDHPASDSRRSPLCL